VLHVSDKGQISRSPGDTELAKHPDITAENLYVVHISNRVVDSSLKYFDHILAKKPGASLSPGRTS
jgi:hypothetical protein